MITIDIDKLRKIQENIEKWGERVGLYDKENGSNFMNQKLKLYDEFGELCEHELKQNLDLRIDDVGDVFVCLVHINKFINNGSDLLPAYLDEGYVKESSFRELMSEIPSLVENSKYKILTTLLCILSHRLTGDPLACFEVAYNDIKDRKGKMVKGSFIKQSDL